MNNSTLKKISKNRFFLVVILLLVFGIGGSFIFSVTAGDDYVEKNHDQKEEEENKNPYDNFALQTMKNQLVKNKIDNFTLSIEERAKERILILDYQTKTEKESDFKQEMALIAGTFVGIKNYDEWDVNRFEATIKDNEERVMGTWYISSNWVEDYNNGKISDEDLVSKIIDSYQSI
jgi:hypothetical protein